MTEETKLEPLAPPRGAFHLSTGDLVELADRLERERRRLLDLYLLDVRRERAIEFGEAEDVADRAGKGWTRTEESSLAESERDRLRLVEEALDRMQKGTYGICVATGGPIPLERLRAVPWARYGSEVQAQVEERRVAPV